MTQPDGAVATPHIDPDDELVCLGHGEDLDAQGGALMPPIVQTSLFAQPSFEALAAGLSAEHRHHVYTRGQNPTVEAVETKIARLERAEACKVTASGMAAIAAVLFGSLRAGDHVLFVNQTYGPTVQLAQRLERFGVTHSVTLDLEPAAVEAALRPSTRIVWLESPGTMLLRRLDVAAIAALGRARGALTVMDNSWASPLFQKPIVHGVDLVVHSATKYLGGHSDVVAGAIVGDAERLERLFFDGYLLLGGAIGPFDAWLLNRGLRTLPARMRAHHAGGLAVARFLDAHPRVRRVFHPAFDGAPADLARGPLHGFSGLLSFALDSEDVAVVRRFVDALARFKIGVSWGGVESLVIAPLRADATGATNAESLRAQGLPLGLVRLSVGLEPPDVLTADLAQALDRAFAA